MRPLRPVHPVRPVRTLLVALLLVAAPVLSAFTDDDAPPAPPPAVTTVAASATDRAADGAAYTFTPRSTLIASDPVRAPHRITDQLVRLIDNVPPGESIEVMTYFLGSPALEAALVDAFRRGVEVRAVFDAHTREDHREGTALGRILNRRSTDRSWVRFTAGSTRASGGAMHQKTWRFSRVGGARFVTVTGSYNASDLADSRAHSLMWQWVDEGVYDAFASVWAAQVRMHDAAPRLRTFRGPGWSAYFSPLTARTPAGDPVMRRLAGIPVGDGTVIRIAMYSMWDTRALWIADRLASMARRGARVVLVAGPTVAPEVRATMRSGGVAVYAGCFRDGTYTHSKDMSASWLSGGRRQYWTWVGSDNWTTDGMASDEAVLGIRSRPMHARFLAYFERLRTRAGGVYDAACRPKEG
ncbi:hypothetical protein CFH99_12770 [Nocardioides aromaticivorans]|uniref:phospholipase D n=1 Tax=Nocardioides aromaticivorans TaxID=200618 RepID=A0ABX7PL79_9ACTN|nr:phospholipase D-like domain-containing protein [Nocardioides aromaticivorans]QSR26497.1 hypothetical protein CFH99_12770 [Nocardioides aromaticivorans]